MDETMWVRTDVVLPPEGQEVLIWTDMIHIARRSERGITKEEREKMRRGELTNPIETGISMHEVARCPRSEIYKDEDEWGNNQKPYNWIGRGHSKFFGQEVKWWMPLPTRPWEEKEKCEAPMRQGNADLAMGIVMSVLAMNHVYNIVKKEEERGSERREN